MLTAALDAARLGARAPLSPDLLRAAAPGYCTSQQQAEAPGNWFEQALAYATEKLHGAAAALSPAGAGMGQIAGYTVADYLIQHASRERRSARVPASTWDALLSHIRDPADAARLADSAERRLLYRYAIPLYRHAADAGDGHAASRLAELLAERGDLDKLRARADAGDRLAAWQLAGLLAERGDLDELRARADAGDRVRRLAAGRAAGRARRPGRAARPGRRRRRARRPAAGRAAGRARRPGRAARPRRRRRRGSPPSGWPSCWPSAATWTKLRARADAGDRDAAERLAELLAERGDLDEAIQILRARADAGDENAAEQLAGLLAGRGDLDEADADPARPLAERPSWHLASAACGPSWPAAGSSRRAATWTRPHRSCAPGPTPATSTPPRSWPSCWPSAATWTSCAPAPTPATGTPPGGWPSCWPSAATWTSCAPGPTPATRPPPSSWPSCWPSAATWTSCAPAPTPATRPPPSSWPSCWPGAATWTGCAPGPTPATGTPPGGWSSC